MGRYGGTFVSCVLPFQKATSKSPSPWLHEEWALCWGRRLRGTVGPTARVGLRRFTLTAHAW